MLNSNFLHFTKMQISSLSQIVWLQLLCIVLYPMYFNQININNDRANVIVFAVGLLMLSYLLLRNFAFNDAKYKTKFLFCLLPVTPTIIIGARGIILYFFCLVATPLIILFSNINHAIKPDIFAIVQTAIVPDGLLFVALFLPLEFLIFYLFEAQKADIIGVLALFPAMGLMLLLYNVLQSSLWIAVLILAIFANVISFRFSRMLYQRKS